MLTPNQSLWFYSRTLSGFMLTPTATNAVAGRPLPGVSGCAQGRGFAMVINVVRFSLLHFRNNKRKRWFICKIEPKPKPDQSLWFYNRTPSGFFLFFCSNHFYNSRTLSGFMLRPTATNAVAGRPLPGVSGCAQGRGFAMVVNVVRFSLLHFRKNKRKPWFKCQNEPKPKLMPTSINSR